jgi:hypothetical protein
MKKCASGGHIVGSDHHGTDGSYSHTGMGDGHHDVKFHPQAETHGTHKHFREDISEHQVGGHKHHSKIYLKHAGTHTDAMHDHKRLHNE